MTNSTEEDIAIEMFVGGLVLDPNTQAPVVVLKDETGEHVLPIWIGVSEATSIASAIKQVNMARPLTHDLMHDIFSQSGIKVQRVVITELKDSTYYAELAICKGDRVMLVDSRPSDAIAIALREDAPIFVAKQVLDTAKATFKIEQAESLASPPVVEDDEESAQVDQQQADFKNIDKAKWDDLLEKLDPDDFKFKM
jgi:bifunctional DNase/RNase